MAFVVKDRVQETSTTTGTGTFTLAGATAGFSSFSVIGDANTTYYTITANADWEVGIGTYTSSGTTLSRDTVLASSNSNNLVNFPAGTKNVFVVYPAGRAVIVNGSTVEVPNSATLPVTAGGTGSSTATFSGANITSLNASSISTGTLANARTTASSSNGASTIVARDASGDFSARTITGTVSVNAPIFYDSNDTGYYLDPNSTSDSALRIRGGALHGPNPTWGAYLLVGGDGRQNYTNTGTPSVCTTNGNLHIDAGSGFDTFINFYDGNNIYLGNGANGTVAQIANDGSFRSPIFYDYNDTTYYLNPAGYSQINGNGSVNGSAAVGLNIFSTGGNGAIMAFHRGGHFAVNMGLDSDNVLRIGGWSAAANRLQMDMSGNLTMAGNVTAYSDERLKKDWELLPTNFLHRLAQVKSGTYTRIDSEERQVGVSAQGLQEFLKEAVQTDASGMLSVNYGSAALVSSVELAKYVIKLEQRISQLELRNE